VSNKTMVIQRYTGRVLPDGTRETTTRYKDWVRSITTTRRTGGEAAPIGGKHASKVHVKHRTGPTTRHAR